ncbi:LOW QUALITY PROTEIN: epiphycan [Rhinatrema bivittatum]|uniref:LOW QUALITY PROTEIN: epiphycan n=1 Tax=Rhinatrema bivittatum TaxID=194408 RepID=UPI00112CA904|nr:LOW QUALITY PROTEIN: epiphycan [Rhinatrema bivittatum]
MKTSAIFFLGLIFKAVVAAPPTDSISYDSETYNVNLEDFNLYDYDENLTVDQGEIEIRTVLPTEHRQIHSSQQLPEDSDEEESTPKLIDGSTQGPTTPGVLGPQTNAGLPTCLLCTCLGNTVYCDDHELAAVPPLPKQTTHFYSRYNKIGKINKSDFANLSKLKKIDLTSNFISEIDEDAFGGLPQLEELVLQDNRIRQLPELPDTMTFIDVSLNKLGSKGIKPEAFKDMKNLHNLYLTDNNLDHIPIPLPEALQALHLQNNNIQELHQDTFCNTKDVTYARRALEDIRLDGNPVNLSKTPQAFMCLPRLPIGRLI